MACAHFPCEISKTNRKTLDKLPSIAQRKIVTGFGAPVQYFKQLNNCRSWASLCINQLFIYAQLY
jgi:hypothetical protein